MKISQTLAFWQIWAQLATLIRYFLKLYEDICEITRVFWSGEKSVLLSCAVYKKQLRYTVKRSLVWFKVKSFWQVLIHLLYVNDLIIYFRQWRYLDYFVNAYQIGFKNRFWNEKWLSSCSLRCYWNIFVNSTSIHLRLYHSISRKKSAFALHSIS